MFNNWYVEEKLMQYKHDEMLKASEQVRLVKMAGMEKSVPLHVKTLSKLGDNLVKAGFWLQGRYGSIIDISALELDDPCWE